MRGSGLAVRGGGVGCRGCWPGGPVGGRAGGPRGSIVAWTRNVNARGKATVVRREGDAWSAISLHRRTDWTDAVVRRDGSVVLAGPEQLIVLPEAPPEPAEEERE